MEFSIKDLLPLADVLPLLLATAVGGLIGAEREYYNKSAGLRTIILICVGSCLFTRLSIQLGGLDDPVRIAANIVTGIGFLGAGAIFREDNRVKGLTTASTIWIASALGLCIGAGYYALATFTTALTLTVLLLFKRVQRFIDRSDVVREYRLRGPFLVDALEQHGHLFKECGLKATIVRQARRGQTLESNWQARGKAKQHARLIQRLMNHPDLEEWAY